MSASRTHNSGMSVPKKKKKLGFLIRYWAFEFFKNLIGFADDIWSGCKGLVSPALSIIIGGFIVGFVGFIALFGECYNNAKLVYDAIKNPNTPHRKTVIATGLANTLLALGGIGVAAALLISAFGLAIAGAMNFPIVIPAVMAVVCFNSLIRNSYHFIQTKIKEKNAHAAYLACQQRLGTEEEMMAKIADLQSQRKLLLSQQTELLNKLDKVNRFLDTTEKTQHDAAVIDKMKDEVNSSEKMYVENEIYLTSLTKQIDLLSANYDTLSQEKKQYDEAHQERLTAEAEMAYNVLDLTASLLVVAGTIVGTAALFTAASIATFGTLPMALLIVGASIAIGSKIFQLIDDAYDHRPSQAIRNKFNKFLNIFSHESKPTTKWVPEPPHEPAPIVSPVPTPRLERRLSTSSIFEVVPPAEPQPILSEQENTEAKTSPIPATDHTTRDCRQEEKNSYSYDDKLVYMPAIRVM